MAKCLAVVFDFDAKKTTFHLLDSSPDIIRLQTEPGLSAEDFFRRCGASAQRAREMFPERFPAAGELIWVAPLGLEELHRQRPDLQKLADMTGSPVHVFRCRSRESPRLELTLESRPSR